MSSSEKTCKKTGIYKITNLINGKVYIGQSIDIEHRWYQEKRLNGVNDHLKSAFLKYGLENFCFEILEECQQEELNKKECLYIKNYNSFDRNFGYNETTGGSKGHIQRGRKLSQKTREKISEAKKGKCFTEEHKKALSEAAKHRKKPTKAKKVLCLENGKVYNTIAEAAKDTNSCRAKISSVCKGKRKTTNGLRFAYIE